MMGSLPNVNKISDPFSTLSFALHICTCKNIIWHWVFFSSPGDGSHEAAPLQTEKSAALSISGLLSSALHQTLTLGKERNESTQATGGDTGSISFPEPHTGHIIRPLDKGSLCQFVCPCARRTAVRHPFRAQGFSGTGKGGSKGDDEDGGNQTPLLIHKVKYNNETQGCIIKPSSLSKQLQFCFVFPPLFAMSC